MSSKNIKQRDSSESLLHSKITLQIEKLSIGGDGIGRHNNIVIFVPDTAPGDTIECLITEDKKNFYRGKALQLIKESPHRVSPPCKHAAECGGCTWQHISHDEQLHQKEILLKDLFKKFIPVDKFEFSPVVPSPRSFRYRNRIQPKISGQNFGFYKKNSHEIINIDDCLISEENLLKNIPLIKSEFLKTVNQASSKKEGHHNTAQRHQAPKKKDDRIEIWLDEHENPHWSFANKPDETLGFSQVNRFQNEDLISAVISRLSNFKFESFIDLYCGAGNFTFPVLSLNPRAHFVGVELNNKLILSAREKNKSSLGRFYIAPVEIYLKRNSLNFDFILLDPPRAGCDPFVMKSLASSEAKKIIYISCHPVALARDLAVFFEQTKKTGKNYQLTYIQPFEMFPQTDHFETIVELTLTQ